MKKKRPFYILLSIILISSVITVSTIYGDSRVIHRLVRTDEEEFLKAYRAYMNNDYKVAATLFEKALKGGMLDDYSLYFLGRSLLNLKDFKNARGVFKRLIKVFPDSIWVDDATMGIGEAHLFEGEYNRASLLLQELMERSGRNIPEILMLLGEISEKKGDYKKAFQYYLRVWRDHPEKLFSPGVEKKMEDLSRKIKDTDITSLDRLQRVENLYMNSMVEEARELLKEIDTESIDSEEGLLLAGRLYFNLRDRKVAEKVFLMVLEKSSRRDIREESLYMLLRICISREDIHCARERLKTLIGLFPEGSYVDKALLEVALLERRNGDIQSSIKSLERAYKEYPESPIRPLFLWNLAWGAYLEGRFDDAESYLEVLLDGTLSGPHINEQATFWLGKIALVKGDKVKGIKLLSRLSSLKVPSYYVQLSRKALKRSGIDSTYYQIGSMDMSLQYQFSVSQPLRKAWRLIDLGLYDLAREELTRSLEKLRSNPLYALEGSYLLQMTGDFHDSSSLAALFLDHNPINKIPRLWHLAYPRGYSEVVIREASSYGIDPLLVYSVIREESGFDPVAISRAEALGLMQVLPDTGRYITGELGFNYFHKESLLDPDSNIRLGVWYLKTMLDKFNGNIPLALAAYNAGPGNVKKWLEERKGFEVDEFVEDIPYSETRRYVKKVLTSYYIYRGLYND